MTRSDKQQSIHRHDRESVARHTSRDSGCGWTLLNQGQDVVEEAAQDVGGHAHGRVAQAARAEVELVADDVVGCGSIERAGAEKAGQAFERVRICETAEGPAWT
jgi:hypothetical protein